MITDWKNKKVAVLGLGVEGLSSVRFLHKRGAKVTILDRKDEKELEKDIRKLNAYSSSEALSFDRAESRSSVIPAKAGIWIPDQVGNDGVSSRQDGYRTVTRQARTIAFRGGENYLKSLSEFDIIVRSPGVKRSLLEILEAEKNGVAITSQTKIFFDLCPCRIIGVTGTKGKGTTSTLIYEMLKRQEKDAYLGGNIGKPPFEFLDKLNAHSIVVLELSSFQLQDLNKSPHIAVMLMTTSEHLDYHRDVYEYVDAKRNILRFQKSSDFAIINRDYPASNESDIHTEGKVFKVTRVGEVEEGCFVRNGKILLQMSFPRKPRTVSGTGRKRESSPSSDGPIKSGMTEAEIIDIKDILLPGKHNLENVCAAVMAAILVGVSKENIRKVLKTFKGLEHRLELVAEIKRVKYYDDSFSTTPETAIAAIEAFTTPEILILGGSSKGSNFTELGRVISNAKNIKAIIGIGKEWPKIKERFKIYDLRFMIIEGLKDMESIVKKAASIAETGDVVLLSPACASFDMFKNYKDRGEHFKKEVNMLKESTD